MRRILNGQDDFIPLNPFGEVLEMTKGLPLEDVNEECKATFKNDIVKVTIQVNYEISKFSCRFYFQFTKL